MKIRWHFYDSKMRTEYVMGNLTFPSPF